MSDSTSSRVVAVVRPWTTLLASGPDAVSWLNGLITCDVNELSKGAGVWGLLLNKRGKIIAELTLVQGNEGLLVGTPSDSSELSQALDEFLVMEDVELEDRGSSFAWVQLHGQRASDIAKQCALAAAWGRVDWLLEGGVALVVPAERLEDCVAQLRGNDEVEVLDDAAWQVWRVAHGLPEFGVDFGPDDNPHQAALDRRAVSWTKGCYLGQEVVCMQDMRGKVKRRLAKLPLPDDLVVATGDPVNTESGEPVGSVTSVADSSAAGQSRAAIVRLVAPHFEPGSKVYLGGTPLTTAALWS